jgi:Predicted membrane protein (DUF2306)
MKANKINKRIGWGIMTFLAMGIVLYAVRYFSLNPDVYFPQQRSVYLAHQAGLITHILGGVLALGLGPFQFLSRLRTRWPKVHRWMGRFYLIGILLGGTAGLYMSFYAFAGLAASLGFAALAVSWLVTGFMAYRTIRAGNTVTHRQWIIRNFSLTFAAVTLRLWMMPLIMAFGETTGYEIVAWVCWIPNLIVAEGIVRGWFRRRAARPIVQSATN